MDEESRRSDRHAVRFKLVYDDGEAYHAGLVRDLSDTGLFIETREQLRVGALVQLASLELDEAHGFDLAARVVRVVEEDPEHPRRPSGMGLEFSALEDVDRIRIQALIERFESDADDYEGEADPYFGKTLPRDGLRRSPSGVWRAAPPANPPGAPREPESAAAGSADEVGDGEPSEDAQPSLDLPILEPADAPAVHFEAPVAVFGNVRESAWPSAPWRDPSPAVGDCPFDPDKRPHAIDPRLFALAEADIGTAIDEVVDTHGQALDDMVLLDESQVSPFLIDAQLREPAAEDDLEEEAPAGHEPLDADAFATPSKVPVTAGAGNDSGSGH